MAAQFLKRHCSKLRPATQAEAARYMKKIVAAWSGRSLSSITKPMIHAQLDKIIDDGSPVAANRFLTWFGSMCNWAMQRDLISASPAAGIARPSAETPRVLSDEELVAVLRASATLGEPISAFVNLLVLTGARRNEVSNLSWDEINFADRTWVLPASRSKNGREHTIPLSDRAIGILKSLPHFEGSSFVLSTGNGALRAHGQIKKRIDDAMPQKIPAWTLHDARRTFASNLAKLGVSLPTVEKLLNHTSGTFAGIVSVYQKHDFSGEKGVAMNKWSEHVESLLAGKKEDDVVVPMRRA